MTVLTMEQIDRELASRTAEVGAFAETLVNLDNHPGLQHLRRYTPTGATAQRWPTVEAPLAALWEDLSTVTAILQSAQAIRERRSTDDGDKRTELVRVLADDGGFAEAAGRLRAGCADLAGLLDAVDGTDSLVADGLGPALKLFDAAAAAVPPEVTDLLRVSATDPLSLTPRDVADRLAVISELAQITAHWPAEFAATVCLLDELDTATRRAAETRAQAQRAVVTDLPAVDTAEPLLRQRLASLRAPDPAALVSVRHQIAVALRNAGARTDLAQGLLDRRRELGGRLTAYRSKAARLGLEDDPELVTSARNAARLLRRRPSDLRQVTLAVTDYRQLLAGKQEKAR